MSVDPDLVYAVAGQESDYNPETGTYDHRHSTAGAVGIMQLMPATARKLGVDPNDEVQNVVGGIKYLSENLDKRNGDIQLALSDYNAGPGRTNQAIRNALRNEGNTDFETVQKYLPYETQLYVPSVLKKYNARKDGKPKENSGTQTNQDDQKSPDAITGGSTKEFVDGVEAVVTHPDFADLDTPSRIQKVNELYNKKKWASGVSPIIKDVANELWKGATKDQKPDWGSLVGPISRGDTPEKINETIEGVKKAFNKSLTQHGTTPEIYGSQIDDYFNGVRKEQQDSLASKNRGAVGETLQFGKEVLRGAGSAIATPLGTIPELAGFQKTADAIKNLPTKVLGEPARELYYETDAEGHIKKDEFGKPTTKLAGSVAQGLGQVGTVLGGGLALKLAGVAAGGIGAIMGGSNVLMSMDAGYNLAKENGADRRGSLEASVLAAPFGVIDTLAGMATLGLAKPYVTALTGVSRVEAVAKNMAVASATQFAAGVTMSYGTQAAASLATGKNLINTGEAVQQGAVQAIIGSAIGAHEGLTTPLKSPKQSFGPVIDRPITEPAPKETQGLPSPYNPAQIGYEKQTPRLSAPEEYNTQGSVRLPVRPDAESEVKIATAFQDFKESSDMSRTFTVRHVADVPTDLLNLWGWEAQVLSKNQVRISKTTDYVPEAHSPTLEGLNEQIRGLQETLSNMPSKDTQGELVTELKQLLEDRRKLTKGKSALDEANKPQSRGSVKAKGIESVGTLFREPTTRTALVQKIQDLNRSTRGTTGEERTQIKARLEDAKKNLSDFDTHTENVKTLEPGTAAREKRIGEIKGQLIAMENANYGNTRAHIGNDLAEKNAVRNIKAVDENFVTTRPSVDPVNGMTIENDYGKQHIIRAEDKWYVTDEKGRPESAGHELLADALQTAQDLLDTKASRYKEARDIKSVGNREPRIPEANKVTKAVEDELALRRSWKDRSKKEYEKFSKQQDKGIIKGSKERSKAANEPSRRRNGTRGLEDSTVGLTDGTNPQEQQTTSQSQNQDSAFNATKNGRPVFTKERLRTSEPNKPVTAKFGNETNFDKTGTKPRGVRDVVQSAYKVLQGLKRQIAVSEGGAIPKGTLGFLAYKKDYIKTANINDIPTITHEVAHAVDMLTIGKWNRDGEGNYTGIDPKVVEGLKETANTYYPGELNSKNQVAEGFSMFMQHYVTGQKVHKDVLNWWNTAYKEQNPKIHSLVDSLRQGAHEFFNQTPELYLKDFRSAKPPGFLDKFKNITYGNFLENWVNSGYWLKKLADISGSKGYDLFQSLNGSASEKALYNIEDGVIDLNGNRRDGLALKTILSPLKGDYEDLKNYMTSMRASKGYHAQDLSSGANEADTAHIIQQVQKNRPDVVQVANNIWDWQTKMTNIAKERSPFMNYVLGKIQDQNAKITGQAHGYYVPFNREGYTGAKLGTALTGSTRRIEDPLVSMGKWVDNLFKAADQRFVLEEVLAAADPELGNGVGPFIRKIGESEKRVYEKAFDDAVKNAPDGKTLQAGDPAFAKQLGSLFGGVVELGKGPEGYHVHSFVNQDGKLAFYEIADGVMRAFDRDMPSFTQNFWYRNGVTGFKNALRAGATTFRVPYQIKNLIGRDFATIYRRIDGTSNPLAIAKDVFTSLGHTAYGQVGLDPWFDFAKRQGVLGSSKIRADSAVDTHIENKTGMKVVNVAGKTLQKIEDIASVGENATRLAAFRRKANELGLKPDSVLTAEQAMELSLAFRRTTTDFAVQGRLARVVNTAVPFFTANIAELGQLPGDIKRTPVKHAILGMGYLAAGIATAMAYKDEDWFKNLDPETLSKNFMSPIDVNGEHRLLKYPLETWGSLFYGIGIAAASSAVRQDNLKPSSLEWVNAMAQNNLPLASVSQALPIPAKIAYDLALNKNPYNNRDIVPKALLEVPAKSQYTQFTSDTAKTVARIMAPFAEATGMTAFASPIKIEYMLKSTTPAGLDAINYVEQLGGKGSKENQYKTNVLAESFLHYSLPQNVFDRGTQKFYDELDHYKKNKDNLDLVDDKIYKKLTKIGKDVSAVSTVLSVKALPPAARDELLAKKREIISKGIEIAQGSTEPAPKAEYETKTQYKEILKERKAEKKAQKAAQEEPLKKVIEED